MASLNPPIDTINSLLVPIQPNRFEVQFEGSSFLPSVVMSALCDETTIPGRNIATTEYTNGRQAKKIPYAYAEDDITMTFLESRSYDVRYYFEEWMQRIINTDSYRVGYKNEYSSSIKIRQQSKNLGSTIYTAELLNAYPTNVTPITLGNAADGIVRVSVTFAYDRYIANTQRS